MTLFFLTNQTRQFTGSRLDDGYSVHTFKLLTSKSACEKNKSEELLLNILPESTAIELKEKGFSSPRSYENVTVLFTDFVNFTKISERMTPTELVAELDYCFKAMDEIIYKNNLEKIKTIGDSYMAVAGCPEDDPEHATHAVTAALEIRDLLEKWNHYQESQNKAPWGVRIGLHSGPIISGVVGKKKFAFDIWGDTVNVASRMESSSENKKVNISVNTYEMVKTHFKGEARGMIKAKNKGEMEMYFVDWPD